MATETRVYRTLQGSNWKANMPKIKWQPLHIVKLETTGLDPQTDRAVAIAIAKLHLEDDTFVLDDTFMSLMNPGRDIPAEITEFNGITNDMLKKAPDSATVFKKAVEFLGKDAAIAGFSTKEFLGPFLENEAMLTGADLSVGCVVNMTQMAKSLLYQKKTEGYGYVALANRFGIPTNQGLTGYIALFNKLYSLVPTGTEHTIATEASYWRKAYDRQYIFFKTPCGNVWLNCMTGFWEEKTPGFFDMVNMDNFTEYVLNHKKCNSIWDLIKMAQNSYVPK